MQWQSAGCGVYNPTQHSSVALTPIPSDRCEARKTDLEEIS